jgi:predicted metal-dependent enzyme (double-stranded beta helix superfamily)
MAIAYLGPADEPPNALAFGSSVGLPAGPGSPLPQRSGRAKPIDLLAVARQFAEVAPAMPEMRQLVERTWILMAVTDLFEVWAIGWPPGGNIELHDHGLSHGAVVVAQGELVESTVRSSSHGVSLITSRRLETGRHRTFSPGYIHDIYNDGTQDAVSVHVYGPRLAAMSYYQLNERGRLEMTRVEEAHPLGPFDTTSHHDPS